MSYLKTFWHCCFQPSGIHSKLSYFLNHILTVLFGCTVGTLSCPCGDVGYLGRFRNKQTELKWKMNTRLYRVQGLESRWIFRCGRVPSLRRWQWRGFYWPLRPVPHSECPDSHCCAWYTLGRPHPDRWPSAERGRTAVESPAVIFIIVLVFIHVFLNFTVSFI